MSITTIIILFIIGVIGSFIAGFEAGYCMKGK